MNRTKTFRWRSARVLTTAIPFCFLGVVCTSLLAENLAGQPGSENGVSPNSAQPPAAVAPAASLLPQPGLCTADDQVRAFDVGEALTFDVGEAEAASDQHIPPASSAMPGQLWQGNPPTAERSAEDSLINRLRVVSFADVSPAPPAAPAPPAPVQSASPTLPTPTLPVQQTAPVPTPQPVAAPMQQAAPLPPVPPTRPVLRTPEQSSRPGCLKERSIRELTTNIDIKPDPEPGTGPRSPESIAESCLRPELQTLDVRKTWTPLCYCWEAPALCYGPLYYEETNLERYGYSQTYLRTVQPLVSGAHFFGTSFMLPYLLAAEPPCECVYTLGEYRPGSCVPFRWNYPYFSPAFPWQNCNE